MTVRHVCGPYVYCRKTDKMVPACGGNYICPGCERSVPNCFGADDELGELCDDCAVHVWRVRESTPGARHEGDA